MKFTDMTPQQQSRSITTMGRCGGGFAGKLADAWNVADGTNSKRLADAFSDLVERFGPDSDFYTFDDKVAERKSFKPVVKTDDSGKWYDNALRFATSEEAAASAADLANRWMMVREHGVQESTDPVTHTLSKLPGTSTWVMGEA